MWILDIFSRRSKFQHGKNGLRTISWKKIILCMQNSIFPNYSNQFSFRFELSFLPISNWTLRIHAPKTTSHKTTAIKRVVFFIFVKFLIDWFQVWKLTIIINCDRRSRFFFLFCLRVRIQFFFSFFFIPIFFLNCTTNTSFRNGKERKKHTHMSMKRLTGPHTWASFCVWFFLYFFPSTQ